MWNKLRDWYLALIGIIVIAGGGVIDGKVNPVLTAAEGQVVQLTLINGEGAMTSYSQTRTRGSSSLS